MAKLKRTADAGRIKLSDQPEGERSHTVIAFLIFGIFIYAPFSLIIASAQDILAGTLIPTSTVLVASVVPAFVINFAATYLMQKIPYIARITTFGCAVIGGLLMLALAKQVHWKLVGIGLASFGEITVLVLTASYHEVASTAFSAGTGIGFVIAPIYYTGTYLSKCWNMFIYLLDVWKTQRANSSE